MSLVWIRAYSTGAPLYSHQVSKTIVKLLISTFSNRMVRLEKKWPLLFSWSTSKDHEIKPSWWVQTSCLFFSVKDFKVWNKEHTLIISNVDKWNNLMLVGLNNGDIFFYTNIFLIVHKSHVQTQTLTCDCKVCFSILWFGRLLPWFCSHCEESVWKPEPEQR